MRTVEMIDGYCVLLCAHNGGDFLAEQLDSIARQEIRPACVLFFDDGSVDETAAVAQRFSKSLPLQFVKLQKRSEGAAGAFDAILNHAAGASKAYAAYVLCDQDDIWEPNKAARLLGVLGRAPAGVPSLVHSELRCFGPASAGRSFLHESLGHHSFESTPDQPLQTLLFENIVVGASAAFNHALLALAVPMPLGSFMHDWWLAIACVAHGGILQYVPEPLTRYRIHGGSTVGRAGNFLYALPRRMHAIGKGLADPWLMSVRNQLLALPFGQPGLPTEYFQPLLAEGLTLFSNPSRMKRLDAWRQLRQRRIWAVATKDAYYKARLFTDYFFNERQV